MTVQFSDLIQFDGSHYTILASSNNEALFEPRAFGLKTEYRSTALIRGHYEAYKIDDSARLILTKTTLTVDSTYSKITSALFESPGKVNEGGICYDALDWIIPYTGGILIADHRVELDTRNFTDIDRFLLPKSKACWMYEKVFEITLREGIVSKINSFSEAMSDIRKSVLANLARPKNEEPEGIFEHSYFDPHLWKRVEYSSPAPEKVLRAVEGYSKKIRLLRAELAMMEIVDSVKRKVGFDPHNSGDARDIQAESMKLRRQLAEDLRCMS